MNFFQRKMLKNALHDYEQLFFSTAEILQSTISNFSCVQSFWFTTLTQKSIKLLTFLEPEPAGLESSGSSAPSAADAWTESLCIRFCRSSTPSSRLLQTLSGTLETAPPLNATLRLDAPRTLDADTEGLQETAIPDVATAVVHARDAIAAKISKTTNKLRFFEIALQMRARQGHVEMLIHVLAFENLIWDVVPPDASGKPCVNWDL